MVLEINDVKIRCTIHWFLYTYLTVYGNVTISIAINIWQRAFSKNIAINIWISIKKPLSGTPDFQIIDF